MRELTEDQVETICGKKLPDMDAWDMETAAFNVRTFYPRMMTQALISGDFKAIKANMRVTVKRHRMMKAKESYLAEHGGKWDANRGKYLFLK